jgi:acyl-coenzyme A thioesterase PaaI-like protein
METETLEARPQSACFACGPRNPHGLGLRFSALEDQSVTADWTVAPGFEGFEGILHGGIVATVLDEAMAKAVVRRGWHALSVELRLRLRKHTGTGETVRIRGWVVERRKRLISAEASIAGPDGEERAHAWGSFLVLDGSENR